MYTKHNLSMTYGYKEGIDTLPRTYLPVVRYGARNVEMAQIRLYTVIHAVSSWMADQSNTRFYYSSYCDLNDEANNK